MSWSSANKTVIRFNAPSFVLDPLILGYRMFWNEQTLEVRFSHESAECHFLYIPYKVHIVHLCALLCIRPVSGGLLNSFQGRACRNAACRYERTLAVRFTSSPWTCTMLFLGHALCLFCALLVHQEWASGSSSSCLSRSTP